VAPLDELKGLAYLDKHGGMPGPHQVHLPGAQVVPNLLCQACVKPFPLNKVQQS